jgi:hypothetical protein
LDPLSRGAADDDAGNQSGQGAADQCHSHRHLSRVHLALPGGRGPGGPWPGGRGTARRRRRQGWLIGLWRRCGHGHPSLTTSRIPHFPLMRLPPTRVNRHGLDQAWACDRWLRPDPALARARERVPITLCDRLEAFRQARSRRGNRARAAGVSLMNVSADLRIDNGAVHHVRDSIASRESEKI